MIGTLESLESNNHDLRLRRFRLFLLRLFLARLPFFLRLEKVFIAGCADDSKNSSSDKKVGINEPCDAIVICVLGLDVEICDAIVSESCETCER